MQDLRGAVRLWVPYVINRFDDYHEAMAAAVERFRENADAAKQIRDAARAEVVKSRAAHPPAVAGLQTPVEYDVNKALEGNTHYELAKAQRDAARLTALMWAAGALVEAAARRVR